MCSAASHSSEAEIIPHKDPQTDLHGLPCFPGVLERRFNAYCFGWH